MTAGIGEPTQGKDAMPDTFRSPSVPRGGAPGHTRAALRHSELLDAILPLLYGWLPDQRWFAGKGRPIAGVHVLAATELATPSHGSPGLLHLLLRVEHMDQEPLGPRERTGRTAGGGGNASVGGGIDCYQLLLGTRSTLPTSLRSALIGRIEGGGHDGTLVYDAPHDTQLAGHLLTHLARSEQVGALRFHRAGEEEPPTRLPARVGTAEQSNTSVVYGDALILKLFRRVSPGINPDLELALALSAAGCERVAAPVAWFDMPWPEAVAEGKRPGADPTGETTTLGMLQRFLPGGADGWELALACVPDPRVPGHDDFTGESYLLGQATAEVHTVLARELPTAVFEARDIADMAKGMARRLDVAANAVPELRPYRPSLLEAFHHLAARGCQGRTLTAQRIHGDLHLGQALRTTDGWVLLDFEGEPASPVEERRRLQPAIRDVAAMLRSFDYAARYRLVAPGGSLGGSESDRQQAEEWARRNRAAFCSGYTAVGDRTVVEERALTRAFEIDKAVYEVLYEARHRPAWLPVPMSAISRLAARTR